MDPAVRGVVVEDDRPCLSCGYNLRGLETAGHCPECGRPVADSLRGNLLRYSNPEYVGTLHRGVVVIQAAVIVQVLLAIGSIVVNAIARNGPGVPGLEPIRQLVVLAYTGTSVASLVGWWLVSSPDPAFAGANDGSGARKVVRATVVIAGVSTALPLIFGTANPALMVHGNGAASARALLSVLAAAAGGIAWIVWFFAAMRYVRWLAPRIPDERVSERAGLLMWLNPVLYCILWIACGLGPLVALILYYNLLDWVRKDLGRIRAEQASGGA